MQHRRPPRRFTPEAIENMRFRYEDTDEPQESIATEYAIHRKTLDRIAKDEKWTLCKDRLPHDVPVALRIEAEAEQALRGREQFQLAQTEAETASESSLPSASAQRERDLRVAEALEQAVEKEVAAVVRKRAVLGLRPEQASEAEKTARTLASLSATLHKVRSLRCPNVPTAEHSAEPQDVLPADIDEFRHALARRIEAFVRNRMDGGVSSSGDISGGKPSER